jgi:hypothetical protein
MEKCWSHRENVLDFFKQGDKLISMLLISSRISVTSKSHFILGNPNQSKQSTAFYSNWPTSIRTGQNAEECNF